LDSELEEARALFRQIRRRPKGFTPRGTFVEVCSLVIGFDCGAGWSLLDGFQGWLGARRGRPELAFWYHVLAVAVPHRSVSGDLQLSATEDSAATLQLLDWLDEYLDEVTSRLH